MGRGNGLNRVSYLVCVANGNVSVINPTRLFTYTHTMDQTGAISTGLLMNTLLYEYAVVSARIHITYCMRVRWAVPALRLELIVHAPPSPCAIYCRYLHFVLKIT